MARSRGYWKKKNSRRQRRILNASLDTILQVGSHRMAMFMSANLAARHVIGNRRELTRIANNTYLAEQQLKAEVEVDDYYVDSYDQYDDWLQEQADREREEREQEEYERFCGLYDYEYDRDEYRYFD